jgi:carotenoid cleavage dioxygenase-like enzyme
VAHDLGPGQALGEGVFVPRGDDPSEEAGWLVSIACDGARGTSELVVVDVADFDGPPVARVRLPQRVPFGFHGTWVAATS